MELAEVYGGRSSGQSKKGEFKMGKGLLLWLIGISIPIILLGLERRREP